MEVILWLVGEQQQLVAEHSHRYSEWVLWLWYFIGQVVFVNAQAAAIARSPKAGHLNSIRLVYRDRWPEYLWRGFVATCLFGLLWHEASGLKAIVVALGISLPTWLNALLAIPLNPFLAGIYGLATDALASLVTGRFKGLRGKLNGGEE